MSGNTPDRNQENRRLFLHEPGWQIGLKVGSEREYCYAMAPGQDFYHRLMDGEIYVFRPEERLCFACAERRGLLSSQPKGLRPSIAELGRQIDEALDDTGVALVEKPRSESSS